MSETEARVLWLLHFPYPDGTWRGLEKCVDAESLSTASLSARGVTPPATALLFETPEAATAFATQGRLDGAVPVRVMLVTPFVRQPLASVGQTPDPEMEALRLAVWAAVGGDPGPDLVDAISRLRDDRDRLHRLYTMALEREIAVRQAMKALTPETPS